MKVAFILALSLLTAPLIMGGGCRTGATGDDNSEIEPGNDLDSMQTAEITIKDIPILSWLALTNDERLNGLMFVEQEQLDADAGAAKRGMLFVFDQEQELSFWMKNTIIPLDIAYARSDGTIVKIYTMTPLDVTPGKYSSVEPARVALEVSAGLFSEFGIKEGDVIDIPGSVLSASGG